MTTQYNKEVQNTAKLCEPSLLTSEYLRDVIKNGNHCLGLTNRRLLSWDLTTGKTRKPTELLEGEGIWGITAIKTSTGVDFITKGKRPCVWTYNKDGNIQCIGVLPSSLKNNDLHWLGEDTLGRITNKLGVLTNKPISNLEVYTLDKNGLIRQSQIEELQFNAVGKSNPYLANGLICKPADDYQGGTYYPVIVTNKLASIGGGTASKEHLVNINGELVQTHHVMTGEYIQRGERELVLPSTGNPNSWVLWDAQELQSQKGTAVRTLKYVAALESKKLMVNVVTDGLRITCNGSGKVDIYNNLSKKQNKEFTEKRNINLIAF